MTFAISGLSKLNYADGWTEWLYKSADAIATVNTAGYFTGDAVNMLGENDLIKVIDTATPTFHFCLVLSNDGTTVDISDGTEVVQTDSD